MALAVKLSEVFDFFNRTMDITLTDTYVAGVSIDSRQLQPGELFVAIPGERYDGHDFVKMAFEQGASAAVVSAFFNAKDHSAYSSRLIPVADTFNALRELAAWYRAHLSFSVVALTGSCGKTTTKEMIATLLKSQYPIFATKGNKNNHFGVPLSLLQCQPEHKVGVFELGANHVGEIYSNVQLIRPDIALITNVGSAHIGEFGGVEGIFRAKTEIFEGLSSQGIAIYCQNDAFAERWKKCLSGYKTFTFGMNVPADIVAESIHYNQAMCASFRLKTPQGSVTIQLSVPGEHNVMNALAACAVAYALHMPLEAMAVNLAKFQPVTGRLSFKQGIRGTRVIDDTYNANLQSVEAVMQVLAGLPGKRFLVLGDMGELGAWAEEHHELIGKKANELKLDGLFTCGVLSRYASDSFSGLKKHFPDVPTLIEHLKIHLDSETTVAIKGSRSSHMEDVVSAIVVT